MGIRYVFCYFISVILVYVSRSRNVPKTNITMFMKKLLCSVLQRFTETDATLKLFEVPEIFIPKFKY